MTGSALIDWLLIAVAIGSLSYVVYWFASLPASGTKEAKPAKPAKPANAPAPAPAATASNAPAAPKPAAAAGAAATAAATATAAESSGLPQLAFDDGDDVTKMGNAAAGLSPPTRRIVYDEDAIIDEPTQPNALILVTGTAQTDTGRRRKRNEDSVLVLEDENVFVVADGMGGYQGGELASKLAVETIEGAFTTHRFEGALHDTIPPRASELARAIQMANTAILSVAQTDKRLEGMGTTISAARFSPNKQRLYLGHVGDSRIYCLRDGELRQMTSDHTMRDLGFEGEGSGNLSRAVGIWPTVPIDIILGKPRPNDIYLLCSDGLSKMVQDEDIRRILASEPPQQAATDLVATANGRGGKDNITVVVVRVEAPPADGKKSKSKPSRTVAA